MAWESPLDPTGGIAQTNQRSWWRGPHLPQIRRPETLRLRRRSGLGSKHRRGVLLRPSLPGLRAGRIDGSSGSPPGNHRLLHPVVRLWDGFWEAGGVPVGGGGIGGPMLWNITTESSPALAFDQGDALTKHRRQILLGGQQIQQKVSPIFAPKLTLPAAMPPWRLAQSP